MIERYALRDDQWERVVEFLSGQRGWVRCRAKDNRLFVDAVLYRYRAGILWRDLPERFGDWKNTHKRWLRWAKTGVWERIFKHLASDVDNEFRLERAIIVRVQGASEDEKFGIKPTQQILSILF